MPNRNHTLRTVAWLTPTSRASIRVDQYRPLPGGGSNDFETIDRIVASGKGRRGVDRGASRSSPEGPRSANRRNQRVTVTVRTPKVAAISRWERPLAARRTMRDRMTRR